MTPAELRVAELFVTDEEATGYLPHFAALPDSAVCAGLPFWWDQARLFRLADELPVHETPVESVRYVLDVQWREHEPCLREVLQGPVDSAAYARVLRCDLAYPIVEARCGDRWLVADGYHRVARATLDGRRTIPGVRVPSSRLPEILRTDSPFFEALNALGLDDPRALETVRRIARGIDGPVA